MVMNKTFRVQSPDVMIEGANWHMLAGLQEHTGTKTKIHPTLETKKNIPGNYHEWDVPDTAFNRAHMARYRPSHKIMEELAEKPKPVVEKKEVKKPAKGKKKMSPQQVKELKSKLKEELDSAGIKYSKSASLSELQRLAIPTS